MLRFLMMLVFSVLAAASSAAAEIEEGFLSIQHDVPKMVERLSASGHLETHLLKDVAVYSFSGFSWGGSSDLPAKEAARFHQVLAGVRDDQYIFIQGRADDYHWHKKSYTKKEYDRLDLDLAMARAEWARTSSARQAYILMPILERSIRGFNLYVATYGPAVPIVQPPAKTDTLRIFYGDNKLSLSGSGSRFGGGVGWTYVRVRHYSFSIPTVSLIFEKKTTEVSLVVGWRPTADQHDFLGQRAQSLAGAEFIWWRRPWLGLAGGLNGIWETLRNNDQFTNRAFGVYLSPKLSHRGKIFAVEAGPTAQVMNFSGTGLTSSWQIGYGFSARFQFFFQKAASSG